MIAKAKSMTIAERVRLHLDVLDKLKTDAEKLKDDAGAVELMSINEVFNLTRHGLEMEVRELMNELHEIYQEVEGLRKTNTA